jgi:hypothetical protein
VPTLKIFFSAAFRQFKACRDALRGDLSAVGAEQPSSGSLRIPIRSSKRANVISGLTANQKFKIADPL